MKENNIVLIGMPASGKTAVGRLLAEKCEMRFIDLDTAIEEKERKTIRAIFAAENGEATFRDMETKALEELNKTADRIVLATGGGTCIRIRNRELLAQLGQVVWLDASVDTLYENASKDFADDSACIRPLLQKAYQAKELKKKLRELDAKRRTGFSAASEFHLDISGKTPEEIVDIIIEDLGITDNVSIFQTVLAIDGPVASGKSTVAAAVAKKLSWVHVNTGEMYRCVANEAVKQGVLTEKDIETKTVNNVDQPTEQDRIRSDKLTAIAEQIGPNFEFGIPDENGIRRVYYKGRDVTQELHDNMISKLVYKVADTPGVRKALSTLQASYARKGCAVLEGRDISTVVCPQARWKIFLVAAFDERVKRRAADFILTGQEYDEETLRKDIRTRDDGDRNRPQGGLHLDPKAIIIDTTDIGFDEVVTLIASVVDRSKTFDEVRHIKNS